MSTDTEFICEVVRVTEVAPHPGADRLDIARFATADGPAAYQVVTQRGAFAPGDVAAYLGVDCVIPKGIPSLDFLFERPDGKGKEHFRLKAARLRGQYSEGLLVPVPDAVPPVVGEDVSQVWNIGYYQAPERDAGPPGEPTPPAARTWWWKFKRRLVRVQDNTMNGRMPLYGVASLRKLPLLFEHGEDVVITEKIHGSNMRFGWLDGRFVVGSRMVIKTDVRSWLARLLRVGAAPGPGWYDGDLWTDAAIMHGLAEKTKHAPGLIFYAELYGRTPSDAKIQDLTYGDEILGVRVFDVFDSRARKWLEYGDAAWEARHIPIVPHLWEGPFDLATIVRRVDTDWATSELASHIMAGVVVRAAVEGRTHVRGKWVSEAYRMRKDA